MLHRFLAISVVAAGVAGCASTKPAAPDATPLSPTAVIERHVVNNGIKGYFPFETNELDFVRPNMRRDEHALKGTGTFSGFLIGTHGGTAITRLDRRVLWQLDTEKEEYTECPLKGCAEKARPGARPGQAAQQPEAPHEQGCTLRMASSNFTVTPTGKKQTINGFDTDEYRAVWTVALRDKQARTTTSRLSMDLWTTPLTQDMRDAIAMETAYASTYAGAAHEVAKPQLVPDEAAKLMASYLGKSLGAADHAAFLAGMKQMQKIKGYPISTELSWNLSGNACAPKERSGKAQSGTGGQIPGSASGIASSLAGMFAQKKAAEAADQASGEPILSFTVEVRQLKVEPLHDSVFEVPAGYKRVQP